MESISVRKGARLGGVMRFFTRRVLLINGVLALMAAIVTALHYILVMCSDGKGEVTMLSFLFTAGGGGLFALCCYAAYGDARFLSITPTPRYSIFAGVIWEIVLFSVLVNLLAVLHSIADVVVAQALNDLGLAKMKISVYDVYLFNDVVQGTNVGEVARIALRKILPSTLGLIEWGGMMYLYLCLLRRWKWATLAVTIGVPVLFVSTIVATSVSGIFDRLYAMSRDEIAQSLPLLLDLYHFFDNVMNFIVNRWVWVRAGLGVGSYALAYVVMRSTPQPR